MTVMSMEQIRALPSIWTDSLGPVTVGKILPIVRKVIASNPEMYALLRQSMETHGQRAPIHVVSTDMVTGTLARGIHRVAISEGLGWETMLVSDQRVSWYEWDESVEGQRYRLYSEERLGLHRNEANESQKR
jgi:hypothetical protein